MPAKVKWECGKLSPIIQTLERFHSGCYTNVSVKVFTWPECSMAAYCLSSCFSRFSFRPHPAARGIDGLQELVLVHGYGGLFLHVTSIRKCQGSFSQLVRMDSHSFRHQFSYLKVHSFLYTHHQHHTWTPFFYFQLCVCSLRLSSDYGVAIGHTYGSCLLERVFRLKPILQKNKNKK